MKKNNKTGSDRTARIVRLIIAACLAVFLWMYINGNDINMITQEINNIPVTLINTEKLSSKGLVLTEQKNYFVNIRVRGSERNVNTLDASQITATVDLAGVKGPGTYTADVVIQGLPNSVILQETQPSELNIKIDSIRHKAHSVTINTSGKPGNNLSVVSATTTDLVRVEGPSDSVNKIKACVATANVQDMTDDTILMEVRDGHIFYYNFDAGVCIAQDDRSETKIGFALADTALTMTIDGKERKADYDMHGGSMVTMPAGSTQ